jgi:quercetin dioxygenase-like cupin family protein
MHDVADDNARVGGGRDVVPAFSDTGREPGTAGRDLAPGPLEDAAAEHGEPGSETEYAPGGINPRHLHPAAITFYVLSGTGVWQEEGKPPVTLKAGDSLFVPAGTIHSHWNPSTSERLRFLEFIVAEKDKGRSIPQPVK